MSNSPRVSTFRRYEDVTSGIGLILFALGALWVARTYPVGTTSNMGPGYFPRAMCGVIAGLGALIALNNLRKPIQEFDLDDVLRFRPLLAVTGSYIAFALTLKVVGLLPATLILIVISGLGVQRRSVAEWALIIVLLETLTFAVWYVVRISVPLIGSN